MKPLPSTPEDKTLIVGPKEKVAPSAPHIPDHQLLRCIGQGSYGEVWLAKSALGAWRAVKVVYRRSFDDDRPYEREFEGIQKYEPISRAHDSQVDILHVGRNDQAGYFFYIMELADDQESVVSGPLSVESAAGAEQAHSAIRVPQFAFDPATYEPRTLRSELKHRGRLPYTECLDIGLSLARALEHLHGHGLIHRDIKPANIVFIGGVAKLADIGLVTEAGEGKTFVGTEGYLSPEGPGTPGGDLYSLGKVLYEMVTGRDRMDFPELPTNLDELPDKAGLLELNEIILRACAEERSARYQSAGDMHADLKVLQRGSSVRRHRLWKLRRATGVRLAVGAAVVALVLAVVLAMQREAAKLHQRLSLPGLAPVAHSNAAAVPSPPPFPTNVAALPAGQALQLAYTAAPPVPASGAVLPQLQFDLLAKRQGAAAFTRLADGASLASEVDDYLIVAQPHTPGWLYIFQVDAAGKVDWLFPKNATSPYATGTNPMKPGQPVQLPAADADRALYLDRSAGIEHVYAVFCAAQWPELELALTQPLKPNVAQRSLELAMTVREPNGLRTRGVGGTRVNPQAATASSAIERVYQGKSITLPVSHEVLEADGPVLVIERWFRHVNP